MLFHVKMDLFMVQGFLLPPLLSHPQSIQDAFGYYVALCQKWNLYGMLSPVPHLMCVPGVAGRSYISHEYAFQVYSVGSVKINLILSNTPSCQTTHSFAIKYLYPLSQMLLHTYHASR